MIADGRERRVAKEIGTAVDYRRMWEGSVVSIHIAREASAAMESVSEVRAVPGRTGHAGLRWT